MRKKRNQSQDSPPQVATPEHKRVTPVDIQQKEFRLAVRGYNEREVDQFLDEVTEEIARLYAENKRLREELDILRMSSHAAPGAVGSAAEAEALVGRAREEAVRIISEARARVSAMAGRVPAAGYQSGAQSGTALGAGLVGTFLAREREFLQGMAGLIQRHAESIKGDVQRVRQVTAVAPSPPETERSMEPAPSEEPGRAGAADPAVGAEVQSERPAGASDPGVGAFLQPDLPTPHGQSSGRAEEAGTGLEEDRSAREGSGTVLQEDETMVHGGGTVLERDETVPEEGAANQDVVDLTTEPPDAGGPALEGEARLDEGSEEPGPERGAQELSEAFATHVGASFGTGRDPAPGPKMEPAPEDEETGAERSLRELFWGEE